MCVGACTDPNTTSTLREEAVVTRVTDGDTIAVTTTEGGLVVRLLGVNAPEKDECYADAARDHLIETLGGRPVTIETAGEDQFGRTLAHVFEGDRHINLELVARGLAVAMTPAEADSLGDSIIAAEASAFADGEGLWGPAACGPVGVLPNLGFAPDRSITNPPGPDGDDISQETIVIVNEGNDPADLTGWVVRDESSRHRFTFPPRTELGPGAAITVASGDHGWDPGGGPVWNNEGDMAMLLDPNGTVVDRWRY